MLSAFLYATTKKHTISVRPHTNLDQANEIEEKDWTELYVKY